MLTLNRRQFIARGAAVVGAAVALPAAVPACEPLAGTTTRALGNTGIEVTLLGMGLGVKAWNGQSELTRKGHDAAIDVIVHAYERGLRYYDMSYSYGAHPLLREAMRKGIDRSKVTLLTKSGSREPEQLKRDIENYRKELDTDVIDVLLMHCLTEGDWPAKYKACMDVIENAKANGVIRAHGVSCHSLDALRAAADCEWVDVLLARLNPFGLKMDAPPDEVTPVVRKAHEAGKGVLAMKVVGEGQCRDRIGQSIGWVLNLGIVDAMPIGFVEPNEIDSALGHIRAANVV